MVTWQRILKGLEAETPSISLPYLEFNSSRYTVSNEEAYSESSGSPSSLQQVTSHMRVEMLSAKVFRTFFEDLIPC